MMADGKNDCLSNGFDLDCMQCPTETINLCKKKKKQKDLRKLPFFTSRSPVFEEKCRNNTRKIDKGGRLLIIAPSETQQ